MSDAIEKNVSYARGRMIGVEQASRDAGEVVGLVEQAVTGYVIMRHALQDLEERGVPIGDLAATHDIDLDDIRRVTGHWAWSMDDDDRDDGSHGEEDGR